MFDIYSTSSYDINGEKISKYINSMKAPYTILRDRICNSDFHRKQYDALNIFVSIDSLMTKLSGMYNFPEMVAISPDLDKRLIANLLNLAHHYDAYQQIEEIPQNVILYATDFYSTEFPQYKYVEDYRSHFINKFTTNPKYIPFTEILVNKVYPVILPIIKLIPNVYFVIGKNIEGSLIPKIVASQMKGCFNVIYTNDLFDSTYWFEKDFLTILALQAPEDIKVRRYYTNPLDYFVTRKMLPYDSLSEAFFKQKDMVNIYRYKGAYLSFLASTPNKERSLEGVKGLGAYTVSQHFLRSIENSKITKIVSNPELICSTLTNYDEETKKEFKNNYYCYDINQMISELTKSDIDSISEQMESKLDMVKLRNELAKISSSKYPILLKYLNGV